MFTPEDFMDLIPSAHCFHIFHILVMLLTRICLIVSLLQSRVVYDIWHNMARWGPSYHPTPFQGQYHTHVARTCGGYSGGRAQVWFGVRVSIWVRVRDRARVQCEMFSKAGALASPMDSHQTALLPSLAPYPMAARQMATPTTQFTLLFL